MIVIAVVDNEYAEIYRKKEKIIVSCDSRKKKPKGTHAVPCRNIFFGMCVCVCVCKKRAYLQKMRNEQQQHKQIALPNREKRLSLFIFVPL